MDVYTPPAAVSQRLPVMVWFYGGAYQAGATSWLDPTPLVTRGKVVVVEVNYRVGPLGFLALPELESPRGAVGNYGLLDQQAGLRWVRQNAAAFGGDPTNVTIFGQSAGGNSVCQQVASPTAAGLFHKAISQSGACSGGSGLAARTRAQAESTGVQYAASLGCTDPATRLGCLRALSPAELLNSPLVGLASLTPAFLPTIDGVTVAGQPDAIVRSGRQNRVPLLIGGNRDEGRLFVYLFYELPKQGPLTDADFDTIVQSLFGADAGRVRAEYPRTAYASPDLALSAIVGDHFLACSLTTEADAAARYLTTPVYTYQFTETDNPPGQVPPSPWMPKGADHGAEVPYLFTASSLTGPQQNLSQRLIDAWATFTRRGNPTIDQQTWPRYLPGQRRTLVLNSESPTTSTGYAYDTEHHCAFWTNPTT